MHISPVEWMWIFILVTPAMIYLFLSDNDDFRKQELYYNKDKKVMSKSYKQQIVSNRMRSVQNGGYTDIFRKEAEAERQKKANLAMHVTRAGGRKWG